MLKFRKTKKVPDDDNPRLAVANSPQGISAKGNALQKIGGIALSAVLIPLMLAFAYLILLRQPALQEQQVDRVSSSFALQQATNIHQLFAHMQDRIRSAALSPLALSAIASESEDDLSLVEKAMLDYFPEVASLRIIPIGDMGTADFSQGNQGLRNHIEVDLVRRTSEGEETQPEAYKFEDRWLTTVAAKVSHPRIEDRWAVIVVTMDNERIAKQLKPLGDSNGRFALEQLYVTPGGQDRLDIIAENGSGSVGPNTRYADVPGTPWRVSFSPSDTLMSTLSMDPMALYTVLALLTLSAFAALSVVLILFPRKLEEEIEKIVVAADQKTSLDLAIPELVPLAKQLRRATLRALRQTGSSAQEAPRQEAPVFDSRNANLTNPLFQSKNMLDEDEDVDEVLELDLAASDSAETEFNRKVDTFPYHVFRAYDIRGDAETELTDELIGNIARAIGTIAGEMGEQALIIGCDGRTSSPRIKSILVRALMETGRDIVDIGLVPTPLLYFATRHLNYRSGIMITGSHNPADQNGLKIVLNQQTIAAGGIQRVRDLVIARRFSTGQGRMMREDIVPAYKEEVLHDIAIAVPLKIVIDAGNGATSELAPKLFEELGCDVVRLNCHIDGRFPGHPPDTSNEANLADLARVVVESKADFGVAFDGDGDRLAVVTPSGRIVRSDVLLMLYAQDVVSRNPGADVVFDVKCSRHLSKLITRHGGRPVLWKTGHAFMKEKMKETGALLGGEFSGHMFFGERWYGFDDGIYAAGRLAEILSTHGESLDESIAKFPATVNTPEIIIPVADDYKFELVKKIIESSDFTSGKVNTMDGIRVDFSNGWGLVRASNTGPALTARFEADTQENLEIIQDEFRAQIALIDPEIKLNF
ncbi:MAG: phosphomannomutase/phosphoglucomutase [Haliea sp.]|nr:phosphomannomutase/phosphoglucomutase [Haliea sp.]